MIVHPAAALFPMMNSDELNDLATDISARGLDQPIMTMNGVLLDGRNRSRACEIAGIIPTSIEYTGSDPVAYIMSANLKRRQLSISQRSALAVELEPIFAEEAEKRMLATLKRGDQSPAEENFPQRASRAPQRASRAPQASEEAAEVVGVSGRNVRTAKAIQQKSPELFEKIKKGELTVSKAKSTINLEERKSKSIAETVESVKASPPKITLAPCLEYIKDIDACDLLITDPPYFTDGDFTSEVVQCIKTLKPTGQAYVFCSADPKEVQAYLGKDYGEFHIEQILVWNYNNSGQRQPNERYTSNHQLCLYFRSKQSKPLNKPADGTHQYACQTINAPDGRLGDRFHSWQKPMELIERLIKNSSDEGDLVFDPFAGSGTTLLAASKLGRIAYGCDVDSEAVNLCITRGCVS